MTTIVLKGFKLARDREDITKCVDLSTLVFEENFNSYDDFCFLVKEVLSRKHSLHKLVFRSVTFDKACIDELCVLLESRKTCLYALSFKRVEVEGCTLSSCESFCKLVESSYLRRLTLDVSFQEEAEQDFPRCLLFNSISRNLRLQHLHVCNVYISGDSTETLSSDDGDDEEDDDYISASVCSSFIRMLVGTRANTVKLTNVSMLCKEHIKQLALGFSKKTKNEREGFHLHLKAQKNVTPQPQMMLYTILLLSSGVCDRLTLEGLCLHSRVCVAILEKYFASTIAKRFHLDVIGCSFTLPVYLSLFDGIASSEIRTLSLIDLEIVDIGGAHTARSLDTARMSPKNMGENGHLVELNVSINGELSGAFDIYKQVAFDMSFNRSVRIFQINVMNLKLDETHIFLTANTRLVRLKVSGNCVAPLLGTLGSTRELLVDNSVLGDGVITSCRCIDTNRLVFLEIPFELSCKMASIEGVEGFEGRTVGCSSIFTEHSLLRHLCLIVRPIELVDRDKLNNCVAAFAVCKHLESVHFKASPLFGRELVSVDGYIEKVASMLGPVCAITVDVNTCTYTTERSCEAVRSKRERTKAGTSSSMMLDDSVDQLNKITPQKMFAVIDTEKVVGLPVVNRLKRHCT